MKKNNPSGETYTAAETKYRFDAIMRGAMHKPTPLKDIPKTRKGKTVKPSPSDSSPAT